ncbi:beta-sarcoglycan [Cylas formicarius]|uniref:beta-sarcoglycan n=1 Tax=Cylas formicarius TaxID=197179 RepID=UPI00295837B2|nr:beta-sarcoglycan [Cylas formicarius]
MNECGRPSPQHSDLLSEENDNRETTLLNRSPSKKREKVECVPVKHVRKPTDRGRKTFAFWTLVILLFILAVGNLILTMTIFGVLRLGQGMQSIEILPNEKAIKFFGDIDLDHIYKHDGRIEGFDGESVEITAEDAPLLVNLYSRVNRVVNKLKIDRNETCFNGFTVFDVKNRDKETIFTVSNPVFNNLRNANNLKTKQVETNKIRSPTYESLKIESENVHLKGAEGTKLEGREIVWKADQDIYLKSVNGSIVLSGKEGTYIDVKRIPIAKLDTKSYVTAQFKICVCMPQGKLFRVPVVDANERVYCHHINMSPQYNPCI